jgi:hypothetical protein
MRSFFFFGGVFVVSSKNQKQKVLNTKKNRLRFLEENAAHVIFYVSLSFPFSFLFCWDPLAMAAHITVEKTLRIIIVLYTRAK